MSIFYIKQLSANYFAIQNYLVFKANLNKMFQKTPVFLLQWKETIAFHKKSSYHFLCLMPQPTRSDLNYSTTENIKEQWVVFYRSQQRIYIQYFCLGLSLTSPAHPELANELWIVAPLAPLSEGATSCKLLWLCIFLNILFFFLYSYFGCPWKPDLITGTVWIFVGNCYSANDLTSGNFWVAFTVYY